MELEQPLADKWQRLLNQIGEYSSAIVAYSGGVDSSLLAYAAHLVLGENMLAVTADSGFDSQAQFIQAEAFAVQHGIPWKKLSIPLLTNETILSNPPERCYFCKLTILTALHDYARKNNFAVVLEGQNADDLLVYRPGRRAVQETGTYSPLLEQQLTKAEIRQIARALGLAVWEAESSPCLATRIPYYTPITQKILRQIEEAEVYLKSKGFTHVRVRYHQQLARIEVAPQEINALTAARLDILQKFHELGFQYITVDLEGYRSGNMDEGVLR